MSDFKFKFTGIILIFITMSLFFKMDFKTQMNYAFTAFDIDVNELSEKTVEKIMGHSTEEMFNYGFYTYANPTTIENKIADKKYEKLVNIINLEKDYNAILIRGYEKDEYVTARYYIELNDDKTLNDIKGEYEEKLINAGYKEKDDHYEKDGIEFQMMVKWDCITLIVKGL